MIKADVAALVERLGYHSEHPVTGKLVLTNPDGPDAASAIKAQAAEIERLRELFRIDGEQHAAHIKGLTQAHEARVAKYAEAKEAAEAKMREAVEVLREIADSDDIDNALDPERNKRIARAFLEQTNDKG